MTTDLWPNDLNPTDDPEPILILKAQADALATKTGGLITGAVLMSVEDGTAYYSLYLKVDTLGDFLYKILYVAFPVTKSPGDPYPVSVQDSFGGPVQTVRTTEELEARLREVFASSGVKTTIGNLLRYAKDTRRASIAS